MPTKNHISIEEMEGRAGVERSEPGGRAELDAGARAAAVGGHPPLPGLPGGGPVERPGLSDELIDELLAGARTAEEIAGPDGLLRRLTRRLLERALQAELTEHLGYPRGRAPPGGAGNTRNGQPARTVLTDQGPVRVRSPRDRNRTFEPKIVGKRQTRWVGFDEKVIALYARGLTVRVIQGHLAEIYGHGHMTTADAYLAASAHARAGAQRQAAREALCDHHPTRREHRCETPQR